VERLARAIPLARVGSPEDIAQAVVFLASSPFVTGHELAVDGGRSVARSEHFG
jgi:pteridine reductase